MLANADLNVMAKAGFDTTSAVTVLNSATLGTYPFSCAGTGFGGEDPLAVTAACHATEDIYERVPFRFRVLSQLARPLPFSHRWARRMVSARSLVSTGP